MTPKELVQKFNAKKLNLSKEQMTSTIAQLLKKIHPEKKYINKTMYLSRKAAAAYIHHNTNTQSALRDKYIVLLIYFFTGWIFFND
jgi:hypothetical protein